MNVALSSHRGGVRLRPKMIVMGRVSSALAFIVVVLATFYGVASGTAIYV